MSMLTLDDVTLRIGKRALVDGVSLDCPPGTLTALIGPNGAGKSTLLGLMAGDRAPTSGHVAIEGRAPTELTAWELAARRAVMPQDSLLHFAYRVRDVVNMGHAMRDLPPDGDERRVDRAMREVEITELAQRDATTLSGGEQARTTFARIRVQETPVVLLDEPTATLDLRHQEQILRLSAEWARQGHCVVAVMHDLNLAAAHADRLALLDAGRLAAVGAPWEVLDKERLESVYRQRVAVMPHPDRPCPVVVTAP